jgi:hypothetical protein
MIRNAMFMFTLALSTLSTACIDEDPQGPQKSEEDDDEYNHIPGDEDDGLPPGCTASLQDSEDPDCLPKED